MPSPFPGMDPYVEGSMWLTLHHQLCAEIARQLAPRLEPKYVARTPERFVYDDWEEEQDVSISTAEMYPDVSVTRSANNLESSAVAVAIEAPVCLPTVMPRKVPHVSVEIRSVERNRLVTSIEVLSPTNKRGSGRKEYLKKRRAILLSKTHLVEVDLLRAGRRVPMEQPLPLARYYVLISRAGRRPMTEVWPIQLSELLPLIPIPLLHGDPDVPLDLGQAFHSVYDALKFHLSLDYGQAPKATLTLQEAQWIDQRLREVGIRS